MSWLKLFGVLSVASIATFGYFKKDEISEVTSDSCGFFSTFL